MRGGVLLGRDDCGLNEWKRQLGQRNGGGECKHFTHSFGSFFLWFKCMFIGVLCAILDEVKCFFLFLD